MMRRFHTKDKKNLVRGFVNLVFLGILAIGLIFIMRLHRESEGIQSYPTPIEYTSHPTDKQKTPYHPPPVYDTPLPADSQSTSYYPPAVNHGTLTLKDLTNLPTVEFTPITEVNPSGSGPYPGPIMGPTFTSYPSPTLKPGPTTTPFPNRLPAKDSAGNVIYFESNRSGVFTAIYDLPVDATGLTNRMPRQLNVNLKLSYSGVFPSPDGSRLAIIGPWYAISIVDTRTGKIERVTFHYFLFDMFFNWYPDNRRILVRSDSQSLWLVDPTGDERTLLARLGYGSIDGAASSPEGKKVIYAYQINQYETWMVDSDGRNVYQLSPQVESLGHFSWSPDGSKIAYLGSGWMVMESDGSNPHSIGTHTYAQCYEMPPLWSPDSQTLAVVASGPGNSFCESSDVNIFDGANIFLIDVKTGEERPLLADQSTGNIDPTWSPDGSKIAFISNRSGSSEVWVVNIDGSSLHQLTADGLFKRFPFWYKP